MTAYYVQPEPSASGGEAYWLEGYAVGDAKFAAAQSDGTSTTLTAPTRVQIAAMLSEGEVTSLFGGNRVVAGALAQSPASATLTGVTRIRFGSIRADATSTTLIGATRVRSPAVVSQSLYVVDDYWFNDYAEYGKASSTIIAANKTTSTGVLSEATSTNLTGVTRVRPLGILSSGSSTVNASSGVTRTNIGSLSVGVSATIAGGAMTYNSNAFLQEASSTVLASLSEKWIDLAEDTDNWTDLSEDTSIWTDVSEDTDTWTDLSPLT